MMNVETSLKTILPDVIQDEIFRLSAPVSDVVIDHLCADIERCGYVISNVYNLDCSIIFELLRIDDFVVLAEIRVDRIFRQFEVVGRVEDETVLPLIGDWDDVLTYLDKLSNSM